MCLWLGCIADFFLPTSTATPPTQHVPQGVRVSDPATVDIAEMVMCGSINKGIASSIKRAGGRAVGLSGKDDNLLLAKKLGKKVADEATGEVKVTL